MHGLEANQAYPPQRRQRTTEWLHQRNRTGVLTSTTLVYRQPLKGNKEKLEEQRHSTERNIFRQ